MGKGRFKEKNIMRLENLPTISLNRIWIWIIKCGVLDGTFNTFGVLKPNEKLYKEFNRKHIMIMLDYILSRKQKKN